MFRHWKAERSCPTRVGQNCLQGLNAILIAFFFTRVLKQWEITMRPTKSTEAIVFSILFLFFLQALSDFTEATYAFALLVTSFSMP
jgi:hypothetical protein